MNISIAASLLDKQKTPSKILRGQLFDCCSITLREATRLFLRLPWFWCSSFSSCTKTILLEPTYFQFLKPFFGFHGLLVPNHLGSCAQSTRLSVSPKGVGGAGSQSRVQSWEVVLPCTAPGHGGLLCSKYSAFIDRIPGCSSALAASSLLVYTELKGKETLQFDVALCYFCWSKSSHPTQIGLFGPNYKCLPYPYYHLFVHTSRQRPESDVSQMV